MGIPVSQRPGRAADSDSAGGRADEVLITERREGTRKSLIGGRLVTVRIGSEASGLALDLSEFGMGLRAFPDLSTGSTASLLFELPGFSSRVEAVGRVEWVERTGSLWSKGSGGRAGLRFIELSETARSILKRWISEDLPQAQDRKPAAAPPPEPGNSDSGSGSLVWQMRKQLQQQRLSGIPALQWIAERVLEHSRADGTAIALDDGQGMVCRATLGNAPDLGVRVHSSGLSGECVRTGKVVCCDDTETDPRVDPELCRQLNLRCALVLPLFGGERLCGVLEVFSSRPYAFPPETVAQLQEISGLVVEVVAEMLPHAELDSKPYLPAKPQSRSGHEPSTVPAEENGSSSHSVPAEPRRKLQTAALSESIRCDACGYANSRGQRICSNCDVPLSVVENYLGAPTGEQVREFEAAALLAKTRFGTAAEPTAVPSAAPTEGKRDLKPLIGVAALVLVASLGFGIWKGMESNPAASQSPATSDSARAESQPAAAAPSSNLPAPAPEAKTAGEAPKVAERAAARQPVPAPASVTKAAATTTASVPVQDAASVRWIIKSPGNARSAVPVEPAPLPPSNAQIPRLPYIVVMPGGPEAEAASAGANTVTKEQGGITGGELIQKVAPVYPPLAKSVGKTGSVVLVGTVDRQGLLKNLHAVEGDPMLVSAAISAAQKWRYKPYQLNGQPIEVETRIVFHFRQ